MNNLKEISILIQNSVDEINNIIDEAEKERISNNTQLEEIKTDLILKLKNQNEVSLQVIAEIDDTLNLVIPTYKN